MMISPLHNKQLGHLIRRCNHAMIQQINDLLRPYGLAHSQMQVLILISQSKSITQKELRKQLGIESGTLTGIVDALVKKGWVTRKESPTDRRKKELTLTEEGKINWYHLPDPRRIVREHMMEGISDEEERIACKVLLKVYENLTHSKDMK